MPQSPSANARQGLLVELPLDVSAVETGRVALMAYLEPLGIEDRVINRLEVVLEELVSNVARHADAATRLTLFANAEHDAIHLCIEDNGAPFNPLDAPEHAGFDSLEDAQLGGLGIPLIKRLTRSIEYERSGSLNRMRAVIAT
jgi:serine/threonine-protein kinase RsbW